MPFTLEIGTSGITLLSQRLEKITGRHSAERDRIYIEVLSELGVKLVPRLRHETPKGTTGALANSTAFRTQIDQDPETNETIYSLIITQSAESGQFIYRPITVTGRKSGRMPPPLALRGWVELKWGLSGIQSKKGAFRLARHIAAFGTQPSDYVEKAVISSAEDIEVAANNLGHQLSVEISDF